MRFLSRLKLVWCYTNQVHARVSPFLITLIRVSVNNCDDQIPHIKCGFSIQPQSCVQRNDFWFCWTVWDGSLFLTHPTCWNKCTTSKDAQGSSRSGFRILKISREVRVLKQSQSALFCSVSHMTILFVFTSVLDVRYQSVQAFVTSFGPFCYGSCKLIHWP